ncbi:two-component regulator propeller domain-containing protein [Maribacter sp. 2307ULW6-5]|uniref:hybrid sensor histidine kinase/response regulator transcription factor n=1 Tax=Maribacter sp. 2307ULW6-5 TaxID=3386275 RepID=UPI0039BCD668
MKAVLRTCKKSIVGILVLNCSVLVFSQQREIFKITSEQGLSHSFVSDIEQDDKGLIWIATGEGLDSYNSYEVKTYHNSEIGSGLTQITSLLSNGDTLFIGTNHGLYIYNYTLDSFKMIEGSDRSIGFVNNLYRSTGGLGFICSRNGLFKIDEGFGIENIIGRTNVRAICDYKANVYFLASDDKILLINGQGETIKEYEYPKRTNSPSLSGYYVKPTLYKDKEGTVWLGTLKGLFKYDTTEDEFKHVSFSKLPNQLEANVVRAISEDENNKLWIGTEYGLFVHDKTEGTSEHYGQSFYDTPNSLSDKAVHSLFRSTENIMWIGTYFGGLNYSKPVKTGFLKMLPNEFNESLSGKAISEIIQLRNGDLWVPTEDGGITIYHKNKNTFSYLKHQNGDNRSISSNNVHALLEDSRGYIWIGTFLGGLNRYDPTNGTITVFKNQPDDPNSISNDHVYSLLQLEENKLLVGTQYGLNIYDYQTDSFSIYTPETFENVFVYDLLKDKNEDLWICTSKSGIYRVMANSEKVLNYTTDVPEKNGLSDNEIIGAYEDQQGQLWFCSYGGGLMKWEPSSESFRIIDKKAGLSNNTVYGILEAPNKGYYVSTNSGLNFYDPKNESFEHYYLSDGLSSNQFNYKSFLKDKEGWMYFGSVNGLTYFHPDSLNTPIESSNINFTGLKLFNKEVEIGDKSPLKAHIDKVDTLTLKHNENAITLEFAKTDYFSEGDNSYSYYLEGYESDWINVGNKRTATYTNLPHGEYTFHLRSSSNANTVGEKFFQRTLAITILPPFWKTTWAFAIYTLVFLLAVYGYYRFLKFIQKKNLAVQLERIENDKIKEINQHKLNFFTFISHEFKTPLTLIIAAIEELSLKSSFTGNHSSLVSVKQSARKLHHLVQQLIKFRKMETDHATLELGEGDIVVFLKDTFYAFDPLFRHKNLQVSFKTNVEKYECCFDAEKLETIVSNLVSNAVKNTKPYGKVKLGISIEIATQTKNQGLIKIQVKDTGSGIKKEDRENLFVPFQNNSKREKTGSGIGLALVKSLVAFLNGSMAYKSTRGKGTSFTIELPLTLQLTEDKKVNRIHGNKNADIPVDLIVEHNQPNQLDEAPTPKEFTLMLVEDNRELLTFLHKHFSADYKVITAKDGKEALLKLEKTAPDIIISDVRMPNMDGFMLCKAVKKSKKTSHVPFLMLTGQTNEQDKLDGLEMGANAFMAKPFNLKELDLLVNNLLESSNNLQQRYSGILKKESGHVPKNNQSREFLLKITDLIEAHYEDPGFTIERLSELAGISRSLLHLKIKKITGSSASDLIKKIRMEKAKILLQEGYSISEVAYMTGYEPSYFSRVFKKHFQLTPTSFAKKETLQNQDY